MRHENHLIAELGRIHEQWQNEISLKQELLAALIDLLPHARTHIEDLNSQMVGNLYPAINRAKLDRAEAAIAKATRPS